MYVQIQIQISKLLELILLEDVSIEHYLRAAAASLPRVLLAKWYAHLTARVRSAGSWSGAFAIHRGVRQGAL